MSPEIGPLTYLSLGAVSRPAPTLSHPPWDLSILTAAWKQEARSSCWPGSCSPTTHTRSCFCLMNVLARPLSPHVPVLTLLGLHQETANFQHVEDSAPASRASLGPSPLNPVG